MSKVIQYLSPHIPRILINRNYVKPPKESTQNDKDEGDNNASLENDFRKDYMFDAYLLGNCDAVTRALSRELGWETTSPFDENGGEDREVIQSLPLRNDSSTNNINGGSDPSPTGHKRKTNALSDRTFVFPGAVLDRGESEVADKEVVHCDGCNCEVTDTIMNCTQCFDYDLCKDCFPNVPRKHFKGKHIFKTKRVW